MYSISPSVILPNQFIFYFSKKLQLHFKETWISNIFEKSLVLCGRIINPLALKLLSTGAEEAGTHGVCLDSLKRTGEFTTSLFPKFKTI